MCGFEAASGHEEENHGAVDLVASPQLNRGLALGRMEGALRVELHVPFEFWIEIVADNHAGQPAIRSFVNKLIADFPIHIDRAEFLGEFNGKKKALARGHDAPADGVVKVVEEQLRENRDVEARLSGVVKTPFDPGIGLTQAKLSCG